MERVARRQHRNLSTGLGLEGPAGCVCSWDRAVQGRRRGEGPTRPVRLCVGGRTAGQGRKGAPEPWHGERKHANWGRGGQGPLGSVRGCAECGRKGYRARLSQRVSGMGPGARSARTRSERSPGSHRGALWPILFYYGSSDSGAGRVQAMQRSLNTETAQGMGDPVGRGGRGRQGRVVGEGGISDGWKSPSTQQATPD